MADGESAPPIARKSSALALGAGRKATRITDAQCLSIAQQLVILDEATELPPFGMCMAGLQQRLKLRLGLEISESAIKACLSPYYDLAEWEDRYITKSLGAEVEEFGSEKHPPRSPLKEFLLSSDGEDDDDGSEDDVSGGGGGGGGRVVSAGSCTAFFGGADDDLGRAGGGDDGGGGAGENMREGEDGEEDEEDAAIGAGATDGEEFGTGSVGGGRARSGGGAGGGAAVAPMPAKATNDAAGSMASSHLARPTTQRTSDTAPSSSTGKVFQSTVKHPHGAAGSSPWGAGGGRAIEFDGMEVQ